MSKQDFDAFISKQVKKNLDEPQVDWDKKRDEWLEYLSQFYETVKQFLGEYEKSGKLNYQFSKKNIIEEYIGSYSVDTMEIKFGKHKVRLEPIGTNVIGADGRVDLIGANGKVKFLLVNKHSTSIKVTIKVEGEQDSASQEIKKPEKVELAWKIATPPPRIKFIDLDQDVFFDALLEVIGG